MNTYKISDSAQAHYNRIERRKAVKCMLKGGNVTSEDITKVVENSPKDARVEAELAVRQEGGAPYKGIDIRV
tara:strand:+ start:49 stop:264 length:216 start_codon:yes stop_codon:yes gene_type:complete